MNGPEASGSLLPLPILQDIEATFGCHVQTITRLPYGQSFDVFKIGLGHGQTLCVRNPKSEDAAAIAKRGTKVLRDLKAAQPSLQAPAIIHEAKSGCVYTILEFLDGVALARCPSLPADQRILLIGGLAGFLFTLWTTRVPGPAISYRDWLYSEIDKGLRRSLLRSGQWGEPLHFLRRRMLASCYIPADDDMDIAVRHGDLHACNVLVNAAGLSGVIDWDTAQAVPLPAAVHYPLFIADIPGWRNDFVPLGSNFLRERGILDAELKRLVLTNTLDNPRATRISQLLSTSFERQFFELSLRNKAINTEFIETRLSSNGQMDHGAALIELDDYLRYNDDLREHKAIKVLRTRLAA